MSKLGVVEDTLFVPMLGRIYASEHYPQILYDKKHWKDDTSKTIVDIQYQRDRNLLSNGVFLQLKSWRRTK